MSNNYQNQYNTRQTPQSQPIPDTDQVKNNAGGYVYTVDCFQHLTRFLVLGSMGGTYYVGEQKLTVDNMENVGECLRTDYKRAIDLVVDVCENNRVPSRDPALFVLAYCAGNPNQNIRKYALAQLNKVARIGTDILHFCSYVENFRGWGPSLKKAVARWYKEREADALAYQMVKYRQRDGWTQRDVLRLSHPFGPTEAHNAVYDWVCRGNMDNKTTPEIILHAQACMNSDNAKDTADIVRTYRLPREVVPTNHLDDIVVWEALSEAMPVIATIRNLGKLTSLGIIAPRSEMAYKVINQLTDADVIRRVGVHPMAVLFALKTYEQGKGFRGSLTWTPVATVAEALEEAFYLAFGNVEPINKPVNLAIDCSGSMGFEIANSNVTCRTAAAAMCMVTARAESDYLIQGFSHHLVDLNVTARSTLQQVEREMGKVDWGSTDCAKPMLDAIQRKQENVEAFCVYTDNETWFGATHPSQALKKYREQYNMSAKLAVIGMTATKFSIADPNDVGMLDIVGFDTATPNIISDFIRG